MTAYGIGSVVAGIILMLALTFALPQISHELDSNPNSLVAANSQPAAVRDIQRNALAARTPYRRDPLGWRYTTPARSNLFRPCRITEGGAARDPDADGQVNNVAARDLWRKDWSVFNPAVADSNWALRTATEQEVAVALARRQVGVSSAFGRENEPTLANCDQQRIGVSQGLLYGAH